MFLALLSLGSIALIGSFFVGEDQDDEDPSRDEDADTYSRLSDSANEGGGNLWDTAEAEPYENDSQTDNNQDILVSSDELSLEDVPIVDRISPDWVVEQPDENGHESATVIHSMTVEGGIHPLTEWASNPELEKVDLAQVDFILVENSSEDGSLRVVQADYYERLPSEDESILHNIHSGANVYFIPDGQDFPDQYQWSESGASLYNTATFSNQTEDFEGIKLILRIDTGYLHGDNESDQAEAFKTRAFSELQEQLSTDGFVDFWKG